jgi:hypothetical protein
VIRSPKQSHERLDTCDSAEVRVGGAGSDLHSSIGNTPYVQGSDLRGLRDFRLKRTLDPVIVAKVLRSVHVEIIVPGGQVIFRTVKITSP